MQGNVEVNGLILFARHGVLKAERTLGQRFILDLAIEFDFSEVARSDRLAHTVDYREAVTVAEAAFCERHFSLIEAAAAHVAAALLAHFRRAEVVHVTVRKPSAAVVAAIDHAAARVTRRRDD
jgi:dihydroneopterin aldolase